MNTTVTPPIKKRVSTGVLAIVAAMTSLYLLLLSSVTASASTVNVYDNSHVLNASQVQSAASSLSYPMDIYTVNTFNGSSSAFDQQTASHTANNASLIVMAIDTVHKHLAIKAGSRVPLSSGQVQNAINAFKGSYGNGDYTGASVAAIQSLQSSLNSSSSGNTGNGGTAPAPAPSGGLFGGFGLSTLCCIGLLVLAGLALFGFFRRRSRGGLFNRQNPVIQDPYANQNQYNQYNQPYNQGYPPGYGPGYNQPRQGMNPWAAGGLGAAAGGFAGYELGRMEGEREAQQNDQNQNLGGGYDNNAGNFGGGASGDFGGGNDGGGFIGDAGGGGGGGGDFGGGGSGNF